MDRDLASTRDHWMVILMARYLEESTVYLMGYQTAWPTAFVMACLKV